jgi:hypothetical protein
MTVSILIWTFHSSKKTQRRSAGQRRNDERCKNGDGALQLLKGKERELRHASETLRLSYANTSATGPRPSHRKK